MEKTLRLVVVDGFRGIFLVFMLVIHANEVLLTLIGKLNHHYFGWVEDAQGFVFMSGLVVGLVYGGRYRMLGQTPPDAILPYDSEPVLFTLFSLLLVTGSIHMGILPMYIFFMMVTPLALKLLDRKHYIVYGTLIVTSWIFAQTQVTDYIVTSAEGLLASGGRPLELGIFFNIFGWQALFFSGLLVGFLMASERLNTEFLKAVEMRYVFYICVALFFFFGIYDRIVFDDWFGAAFSENVLSQTDRGNFSTIYPVTFLIDLIIVAWLLGPGMTDGNALVKKAAHALHWVVTLPPLVYLGRHSLHVFTAHIIIVYIMAAIFQDGPPSEWVGTLLILISLVLLYGVAWLHTQEMKRKKAKRA